LVQTNHVHEPDALLRKDTPPGPTAGSRPPSGRERGGGPNQLGHTALFVGVIGTIASQAAVLAALLYYIGWARTHATFDYFGVSPKIVGFTTQDYILRSLNSAFPPLIVIMLLSLGLLLLHRAVLEPRLQEKVRWLPRLVVGGAAAAGVLAALVCARLLVPGVVPVPRGLLLPACLLMAVALVAYSSYLHSWSASDSDVLAGVHGRVLSIGLLGLGLVGVLWFLAVYAQQVGEQQARVIAAGFVYDPPITVYSSTPLALNGPGVAVTKFGADGDKYRYAYTGLRMLLSGNGKLVLVPSDWRKGENVFVLSDDGSLRIDITTTP
jgi:hypothetical protein